MDNLEQRVKRRSFLKKTVTTLGSIALAAYLGLTAGLSTGCKNSSNPPGGSKLYTISCQNTSIFDGGNIGGTMTLKYSGGGSVKIGSGGSATINGESSLYISDLVIDAPGYINAYVLTHDNNGRQLTTRDANGFKAFTITDANITIINYIIPSGFDTVLFAQCIGNNTTVDSGDGTVQRYDHPDKTVKVGTLPYPDKPTALTLEYDQRAAQIINDAAQGTLIMDYIGEVSSGLDNGCVHTVDNNSVFMGGVIVSGNTYQKSNYFTPNVDTGVSLQTVIEEMMNSSTGIRWDAGGAGSPYIDSSGIMYEGRIAIILVNKMPLGFKFSTTGIPAVNTQDFQSPESLQEGLPGSIDNQHGIIPEHPGINRRDKRIEREFPDKKIRN
jgi:hypothetical protein